MRRITSWATIITLEAEAIGTLFTTSSRKSKIWAGQSSRTKRRKITSHKCRHLILTQEPSRNAVMAPSSPLNLRTIDLPQSQTHTSARGASLAVRRRPSNSRITTSSTRAQHTQSVIKIIQHPTQLLLRSPLPRSNVLRMERCSPDVVIRAIWV